MGAKMRKTDKIVEELLRSGFEMTLGEFFNTTIEEIFRKYCIGEQLSEEEEFELVWKLVNVCVEDEIRE